MTKLEDALHLKVCNYLRQNFPGVIFRTDFSAGVKMTMGQAVKHKKLQSGRGYPDLFIPYPTEEYHGLFIELKADNVTVYKKDGELVADEHIREQAHMLDRLRGLGYRASFARGLAEATELIDDYLKDFTPTSMEVLRAYQKGRKAEGNGLGVRVKDSVVF